MTQYEMAEKLADRMHVTLEEAKTALEACDWDMLDASLLLEKEKGSQAASFSTRSESSDKKEEVRSGARRVLRGIGNVLRRLIACGNRNRLEVWRRGEKLLELPVTALVLMLVFMFWVIVPLLVVGLFTGFRYRFSGDELGREGINRAMDKAADAAEKVKEQIGEND